MAEAERVAVVISTAAPEDRRKLTDYLNHSLPEFDWTLLVWRVRVGAPMGGFA